MVVFFDHRTLFDGLVVLELRQSSPAGSHGQVSSRRRVHAKRRQQSFEIVSAALGTRGGRVTTDQNFKGMAARAAAIFMKRHGMLLMRVQSAVVTGLSAASA
jgi:hypothetical protein